MKKFLLLFLTFYLCANSFSQTNKTTPPPPCTAPETRQFDFWIGDWNASWGDTGHATNSISKILGSCAVEENFYDAKSNFRGRSWSVYSPQRKLWQQTWVDNQGAYIALTGTFKDGQMILTTQPKELPNGKKIISRMVYSNITKDSFDWDWQASTDDGATWTSNWKIFYRRK